METSTPDLAEAKEFAEAIQAKFPGKMLAYNCSPSFNWRRHLDEATIAAFQKVRASLCAAVAPENEGLVSSHPLSSRVTALVHRKHLGSLETGRTLLDCCWECLLTPGQACTSQCPAC